MTLKKLLLNALGIAGLIAVGVAEEWEARARRRQNRKGHR